MFGPWFCDGCNWAFRGFLPICIHCGKQCREATIPELEPAWFGGATNEEGEVYGG